MSLAIAGYAHDWQTRDARPVGAGAPVPRRTIEGSGADVPRRLGVRQTRRGEPLRKFPPSQVGDRFGDDFVVVALLPAGYRGRSDERVEIRCTACDEPTRKIYVPTARNYPPTCKAKRRRGRAR